MSHLGGLLVYMTHTHTHTARFWRHNTVPPQQAAFSVLEQKDGCDQSLQTDENLHPVTFFKIRCETVTFCSGGLVLVCFL